MERHLIRGGATVVKALEALNRLSGATMVLFAVDEDGKLLGSLTDGDIRRALLSGCGLHDAVAGICRRDCLRIESGAPDLDTIAEARHRHITLLPVVSDGKVVSLLDLGSQRGLLPIEAVLMAGGMGERLRPLTEKVPKPLLPVGGRPIIDHNIDLLRSFGINNIFVTVNYLKEQIAAHLQGVTIVEEPTRLGTIGSVRLAPLTPGEPVLVMNADLLTDIDLEAMYLRHVRSGAWLTVAVVPYSVSVPFAIVEHKGSRVTGITEKPTYNHYANAGIYLLGPEAVERIPRGEYMDATDLIDRLLREGRPVSLFPIEGRWLDIGSPDDYRRALEVAG